MSIPVLDRKNAIHRMLCMRPANLPIFLMEKGAVKGRLPDSFASTLSEALIVADPVVWEAPLIDAAIVGAEVFVGQKIQESQIPTRPQFWYVNQSKGQSKLWRKLTQDEQGLKIMGALIEGISREIMKAAMQMAITQGQTREVAFINGNLNTVSPTFVATVFYDIGGGKIRAMTHEMSGVISSSPAPLLLFAAWMFSRQEFLTIDRVKHKYASWKFPKKPIETEVLSVVLRRRNLFGSDKRKGDRKQSNIRWIVAGHWRRLKNPRKSDGAAITYVRPYVKGKEGFPLVSPKKNVFHVKR